MKYVWTLAFLALLSETAPGWSQDKKTEQTPVIGYRDADNDGKNDLFRDADGDGKNDVTGKPYPHRFKFTDENGDGMNDLFRDADGDGMNDVAQTRDGRRERNQAERAVDADGDGINDVSGKRYAPPKFLRQKFIDENADGLSDRKTRGPSEKARVMERKVDRFSDQDGDGINDNRGLERDNRGRVKEMEERGVKGKAEDRGREK
ncbi:MAG: hypothetical protein ACYC9O_04505 [Candidatus Latescibacterota bacterium]